MAPAAVSFDSIETDFASKHPKNPALDLSASASTGMVVDLSASGSVEDISASAVGFEQSVDELIWVKAGICMTVKGGRHIYPGDFVQLKKGDANLQVSLGRAEFATAAQVAEAQKKGK